MGTLNELIHNLPGTTFSNSKEKSNYDSANKATFTLREFEELLLVYITKIYHQRFHKGINTTPIAKYIEGIFGSSDRPGTGFPTKIFDERKVRLDFMPYFERTVQEYGVKIDHIDYYHDVLRKWVHATEGKSGKSKVKQKFIFKRDPRDISVLYFWDPEIKDYFPIPYRNIAHPSISIWEFRKALKDVKDAGKASVDEDSIFKAYNRINEIKEDALRKKSFAKKSKKANSQVTQKRSLIHNAYTNTPNQETKEDEQDIEIKPFEDLDYGSSI
jgi:putative transposase